MYEKYLPAQRKAQSWFWMVLVWCIEKIHGVGPAWWPRTAGVGPVWWTEAGGVGPYFVDWGWWCCPLFGGLELVVLAPILLTGVGGVGPCLVAWGWWCWPWLVVLALFGGLGLVMLAWGWWCWPCLVAWSWWCWPCLVAWGWWCWPGAGGVGPVWWPGAGGFGLGLVMLALFGGLGLVVLALAGGVGPVWWPGAGGPVPCRPARSWQYWRVTTVPTFVVFGRTCLISPGQQRHPTPHGQLMLHVHRMSLNLPLPQGSHVQFAGICMPKLAYFVIDLVSIMANMNDMNDMKYWSLFCECIKVITHSYS